VIGLASAAIHCALDEYSTGTFKEVKFVSKYAGEYSAIMMRLGKLQAEMKGKYCNMKRYLTERVIKYSRAFAVDETKKGEDDDPELKAWGTDSEDDSVDED